MLTRARRRLASLGRSDEGMTLMELTVAMAVSGILAVMSTYFFIGTSNAASSATEQSLQNSQARSALQSWTQLIRLADSPGQPGGTAGRVVGNVGPSTVTFWAALGNRTGSSLASALSRVTFSMANSQLSQSITDPSGNTSSTILLGCASASVSACTSRAGVKTGAFTPYYTATGCPARYLTSAGLCSIDPTSSPSVDDTVAIGISFTITGITGQQHARPSTYATVVTLGSTT